jgi:hypothetical protein
MDSECPQSGVCDYAPGSSQRSCIEPTNVIYVAAEGVDTNPCSKAEPCKTLQRAVDSADGVRKWVVLGPGNFKSEGSVQFNNKTVVLVGKVDGPGYVHNSSISTAAFAVPAIKIEGVSDVTFRTVEIKDTNHEGNGVECAGAGTTIPRVTLQDVFLSGISGRAISSVGCVVTLVRNRVLGGTRGGVVAQGGRVFISASELEAGQQGAVSITGASFELINNLIFNNGGQDAPAGGVRLSQITADHTGRFEHNTVTGNYCSTCAASGVECAEVSASLVMSNNIVYGNSEEGGKLQVGGDENCTWTFSNIGPHNAPKGEGNINAEPMWVDAAQNDFHILPTSPAVDHGDSRSMVRVDVDGDERPLGAKPDMGADEAK